MSATRPKVYYLKRHESKALIDMMFESGVELRLFSDAESLQKKIYESVPSVCLLDLEIPYPTQGIELLQSVQMWVNNACPVFIVAHTYDPNAENTAIDMGAKAIFSKPIDRRFIIQEISPYLATPQMKKMCEELSSSHIVTGLKKLEGFAQYEPVAEIKEFYNKINAFLHPLHSLIIHTNDINKRVAFYAERLLPIEDEFKKYVHILARKSDADLTLEQCVQLFSVNQTKDFLIALHMHKHFYPNNEELWDEHGSPVFHLKSYMEYSQKAEEHFGFDSRYGQVAYFSGLLFDYLKMLNKTVNNNSQELGYMIDAQFRQSLTHAQRAFELGKTGENLILEHFVVPLCLLKNWGKLYLAITHKKFIIPLQMFQKHHIPMTFQRVFEDDAFKVPSVFFAALACSMTPVIHPCYRSLYFWDIPFFLNFDDHDLKQLAIICERAFKGVTKGSAGEDGSADDSSGSQDGTDTSVDEL